MAIAHALIIDDDAYNVHVMERLLDHEDISYTSITDSTELEAVLQRLEKVDVIFVDLEMPKRDGYEVLDILKNKMGIVVPIVACTVHTAEIKTTRKLGFFSFVAKPLEMNRFLDHVHRILNGEPVWDTGA
ncbi:MAG TPA: response regulator [Aggregatilineaceae bacterium]|nr:response regulator [Aggregatilineaceae bacterium]